MSDRRKAISAGKKPATSSKNYSSRAEERAKERANIVLNVDDEKMKHIAELETRLGNLDQQLTTKRKDLKDDVTVLSRDNTFIVEDAKGVGELKAFLTNVNAADHRWSGRVHLKVKVARTYPKIRNEVDEIVAEYNQRALGEEDAVTVVE